MPSVDADIIFHAFFAFFSFAPAFHIAAPATCHAAPLLA